MGTSLCCDSQRKTNNNEIIKSANIISILNNINTYVNNKLPNKTTEKDKLIDSQKESNLEDIEISSRYENELVKSFVKRNQSSKSFQRLKTKAFFQETSTTCNNLPKYLSYYTSPTLLLTECKLQLFEVSEAYKYGVTNEEINEKEENEDILYDQVLQEGYLYYGGKSKLTKMKEGFGVQLFSNGRKYEGYWKDDKYDLYGRLIDEKGLIIEGSFRKGELNGKGKGYYTIMNEEEYLYEGNFKDSLYEGKGNLKIGKMNYIGYFVRGKKDGEGRLEVLSDGEIEVYEGKFKNDELKTGKLVTSSGDIYEGTFDNYQLQGKGKAYFAYSKEEFEGFFENGKRNGNGKLKREGVVIYDGNYVNDLPHGEGILFNEIKGLYENVKMRNGMLVK